MTRICLKLNIICALALLTIASTETVNAQQASSPIEALKTCVLERVPSERQKNNPKYDTIKRDCSTEYDALLAVVNPKILAVYKKLIRDDIEEKLKKQ